MTIDTFLLVLATGAAGVGLWLALRLQRLMPKSVLGVLIDLALVWGALQITTLVLVRAVEVLGAPAAVMLVVFPTLVVVFALAAWVIMFLQALLRTYR